MRKLAFDNDLYIKMQSEKIEERISQFGNKLYLELGGKLFDDYHASRILPGFQPDTKIKMLLKLKDRIEVMISINANDIEKNKVRSDLGITYDQDTIRLIDAFKAIDLYVGCVVITQYNNQASALAFKNKLEKLNIKVILHYPIANYPSNVSHIVSEEGYGLNEYHNTTRDLIIITAPGPGSGKMATCLSQMYHDNKRNIMSGYAKFETFPVWNLPLKHPINLAYEAATADLKDVNMIDPFHLESYNTLAVNYNRDVEVFPVLKTLFEKILGSCPYKSPTDMGVNMIGYCISDNDEAVLASKNEIIRRYYSALVNNRKDLASINEVNQIELIMNQANIDTTFRKVVTYANKKAEENNCPCCAIELSDGTVITGKTSSLLGAVSSCLLNTLKHLAGIDDSEFLILPSVIEPIQKLKINNLGNSNPRLHPDEILIALAVSSTNNKNSELALSQLEKLKGCEIHSTVILQEVDVNTLKKLGMNLTQNPIYQSKKLYHKR